jgi:hypothetical protein
MMRGGERVLAAQLLLWLCVPVVSPAQTQLVRTRDVGFAAVHYDNGLTLAATTLYEGLVARRAGSMTALNGVLSAFHDGRWSMQGFLDMARTSDSLAAPHVLMPFFRSVRSEMSLGAAASAQTGFMPTVALTGRARVLFDHVGRGFAAGVAVARAFDGRVWQTTLFGDASYWQRAGNATLYLRTTPMQLAIGDMLQDTEAAVEWSRGRTTFNATLGARLGEARNPTTAWASFSATWPIRPDLFTSLSVGSYPQDLLQSLPGGRYMAVSFRLPNGRLPPLRRRPLPLPTPPRPPELPVTHRLALVIGFALDSADLREIRVWAPGVRSVELMADFVDWLPVPLVKQANGEWIGYYRITPGRHRLNLRLDRQTIDVPTNLVREDDDFQGAVAVVIVR